MTSIPIQQKQGKDPACVKLSIKFAQWRLKEALETMSPLREQRVIRLEDVPELIELCSLLTACTRCTRERYPNTEDQPICLMAYMADVTLTNISRIIVPGASRTTRPTNIPPIMATNVSWMARIRFICR